MSRFLRDYAESLDVRRFQAMPAREDSRTIYGARHRADRRTRVGIRIKQFLHWSSCGAVLQQDDDLWLYMPFLRCSEKRSYIFLASEIVAHYVDASPNKLPVASMDFRAFYELLYQFHVYSNFDYWLKETICTRRLRTRGDTCCFSRLHYVDIYTISASICSVWFVLVLE